jgi:hypothetical protein
MSLIHSSKTARKAESRKTKINFPLLSEKRRWEHVFYFYNLFHLILSFQLVDP